MALMKRKNPTVIRSTLGHSVYFPGNDEAVFVPAILQGQALEAGAEFVEDKQKEQYEKVQDETQAVRQSEGPVDIKDRQVALVEGVRKLALANNSDDFTAGGLPKVKALAAVVGFRMDISDVRAAWEEYTQAPYKEV